MNTPEIDLLRMEIGAREILLASMIARSAQRDRMRAPQANHPQYRLKYRNSRYDSRARIKRARRALDALRAQLRSALVSEI